MYYLCEEILHPWLQGFYDSNNSNGGENVMSKKNPNEIIDSVPVKKKIGKFKLNKNLEINK